MSFEELIESRIKEAQERGDFSGLDGEGKPLKLDNSERLLGDSWAAFRILRNAKLLPEWLQLAREIEERRAELDRIEERHERLVELALRSGDWRGLRSSLRACRQSYEEKGRELRRRQDRFNMDAPQMAHERPAIWVEFFLKRMDDRVVAAGGPADYYRT